jgi:hypothetical protein
MMIHSSKSSPNSAADPVRVDQERSEKSLAVQTCTGNQRTTANNRINIYSDIPGNAGSVVPLTGSNGLRVRDVGVDALRK